MTGSLIHKFTMAGEIEKEPGMRREYDYFAFISYSRRDSKAATWLQRRLEWFRFPLKLVPKDRRPLHSLYVRPIYRDKTNLEVTDQHYWANIRRALERSRYLIVLCSPDSAKSKPVDMEVAHFLATHRQKASLIAPVIIGGDVTDKGANAALCPALCNLGAALIHRNLPSFVSDGDVAERDAWEAGFVSLVSYLLALDRTALGDHIRRQERQLFARNRALAIAFALLALAAIAGGVYAWLQRASALEAKREIEAANEVILKKNSALEKANWMILDKNKEITSQNETNLKNLHDASMADFSVGVQRIEKEGKWHEGVAHLVRSLKWEPGNSLAASWLYSTLCIRSAQESRWPRHIFRHEDSVEEARFSPDGSRILTLCGDKIVRVWDTGTGEPLGELRHTEKVENVQFSPDSGRIFTVDGHKTARVWDAGTGKLLLDEPLQHKGAVSCARFSPDGSRLVTVGDRQTARVWNVDTGEFLVNLEGEVHEPEFSPDGSLIVWTDGGRGANVVDTTTGKLVAKLLHSDESMNSAGFSPDGKRLVTADSSSTVRVWDLSTGKSIIELPELKPFVGKSKFSPDGARILTIGESSSDQGVVQVWDAVSGKPVGKPMRHSSFASAEFSPDGDRILTVDHQAVWVWDVVTGKIVGEPLLHEDTVTSAEFSPDGLRIVTASDDKAVRVWDAAGSRAGGEPLYYGNSMSNIQSSADGSRTVSVNGNNTAQVWDANTGKRLGKSMLHEGRVTSLDFSADGLRIVTICRAETAQVWDAVSGKPIGKPLRHGGTVIGARFSPDGSRVVIANADYSAQVWDAATDNPVGEPVRHPNPVKRALFSPDGSRVLTLSASLYGPHGEARLLDAASGKAIGEPLRHEGGVNDARFSPDGTRIVTAGRDNAVRVWDAKTGVLVGKLLRFAHPVSSAQFSPDGSRILTNSGEPYALNGSEVRVWDVGSGKPICGPMHHDRSVEGAQFSADGSQILTVSEDKIARVWDAATAKLLSQPVPPSIFNTMQFSRDGAHILATQDKGVWEWKVATGQQVIEPIWQNGRKVESAQFSPDGSRILTTAPWSETAQMWDAVSGKPVYEPFRHANHIQKAQFSADGFHVITASIDATVRVWDAKTGVLMDGPFLPEGSIASVASTLEGSRIVTIGRDGGDFKTATVWDIATGRSIGGPLHHKGAISGTNFSADATRVVTASEDGTAQVWEVATGKPLGEPLRHKNKVRSAQFSPDATRVVTASEDGTAQVWEVATGKPLGEPLRHENIVKSAQFNGDGLRIVSVSGSLSKIGDEVRVWDAASGKELGEPMHCADIVGDTEFALDDLHLIIRGMMNWAPVVTQWDISKLARPPIPVPEWVLYRASAIAGLELNPDGELQTLPPWRRRAVLLEPVSGNNAWAKLARWLVLPPTERTIMPDSNFTYRQIAERERDSGTTEGLELALRYDPSVPLAHVLLAGAILRRESENERTFGKRDLDVLPRAAFLRRYGMMLLPQDVTLWTRAAASLLEQQDIPLALKVADRALVLDPTNAEALRLRASVHEAMGKVEGKMSKAPTTFK